MSNYLDLRSKKFFKITNEDNLRNCYDCEFINGIAIYKKYFNTNSSKSSSGFYFVDIEHVFKFIKHGVFIYEIELPFDNPDFKIVAHGNKYRSNMIIFGRKNYLYNIDTLKYLIDNGAHITLKNIRNIISYALEYDILELLQFILNCEHTIFTNNYFYKTKIPKKFISTVMERYSDIYVDTDLILTQCFIDGGADIDDMLTQSIKRNNYILTEYLLTKYANPNKIIIPYLQAFKKDFLCIDSNYNNLSNNYSVILDKMIQRGADPKQIIIKAAKRNIFDIVIYVLNLENINIDFNEISNKVINNLIRYKKYDLLNYLVKRGINISKYSDLLIDEVIKQRKIELLKLLIENGIDIHGNNEYCLKLAAYHCQMEIIEYLIDQGANINSAYDNNIDFSQLPKLPKKFTLLPIDIANNIAVLASATMGGNLEIVKYLVSKGANIKENNDIVLSLAVHNSDIKMMKYLIECGADIRSNNDMILLNSLISENSKITKFIFENIDMHSKITNKKILKLFNFQVNEPNNILVLHILLEYACSIDNVKLVKNVINHGITKKYVLNFTYDYNCPKIEEYINSISNHKSKVINNIIRGMYVGAFGCFTMAAINYLTQ